MSNLKERHYFERNTIHAELIRAIYCRIINGFCPATGKVAYTQPESAPKRGQDGIPLYVYHCTFCDQLHVTSHPRR